MYWPHPQTYPTHGMCLLLCITANANCNCRIKIMQVWEQGYNLLFPCLCDSCPLPLLLQLVVLKTILSQMVEQSSFSHPKQTIHTWNCLQPIYLKDAELFERSACHSYCWILLRLWHNVMYKWVVLTRLTYICQHHWSCKSHHKVERCPGTTCICYCMDCKVKFGL